MSMKQKQPLRRLLSLLLLTTSMLSALPLSAEEWFIVGSLTYTSDDNSTASVSRCDYNASGELIIPESVEYDGRTYSVTSIGDYAFESCSSLTSVEIPNSVTSISTNAFASCSSLTNIHVESGSPNYCSLDGVLFNSYKSVLVVFPTGKAGEYQIPSSVTSIGDYAFSDCSNLTSVEIPSSVTSIGDYAFSDCSGLTDIQVDSGNPNYCSLDGVLFNSYKSELITFPEGKAREYQIPNSVRRIGDGAFIGCSGLTSVTIPNSVTRIGERAFGGCSSLTSVTIPNSVTNIGNAAFADCSGLTSIEIPNSVTNINRSAFAGCSSLTSVTIPNSVTSIGDAAFWFCSSLTSVTIPNSVTSISYDAFSECDNLKTIYLFGKSANQLPVESVYTFYDNGYHCDNAVYLIGEISTTQNTAEFDVQKVGEVVSFEFEYTDATGAVVNETADQSGHVSLGNLPAGSTTMLKITVHMANGEAYEYNSEVTTKDADGQSAIEVVETIEESNGFDIYTTSGECVHRNATDLSGLRPGIYIANGRKHIVR